MPTGVRDLPKAQEHAQGGVQIPQAGAQEEQQAFYFGPYVDYLLLNIRGSLSDSLINRMVTIQRGLRESKSPGIHVSVDDLPGGSVYLSAYSPKVEIADSRAYTLHFRNDLFIGAITTKKKFPAMRLRFHNRVLYGHSLNELDELSRKIAQCFFVDGVEIQVSRFDFALDVQDPRFDVPEKDAIVSKRRRKIVDVDGAKGGERSITVGYGSKEYIVKIYDKSAEIAAKEKDYILDSYHQTGTFLEGRPVTRVELRYMRNYLRDLKIETVADLKESLGDLVFNVLGDGASSESTMVRITDPESSKRRDRRKSTPSWRGIVNALIDGQPVTGRKVERSKTTPTLRRAVQDMISSVARAYAELRYQGQDVSATIDDFPDELQPLMKEQLRRQDKTLNDVIDHKYDQRVRNMSSGDLPPKPMARR